MPRDIDISLNPPSLSVSHGAPETATVTVANLDSDSHRFQVVLLGDASAWAAVEPAEFTVEGGGRAQARLTLAPPTRVPAGTATVLGIRVVALDDAQLSRVEEIQIAVVPGATPTAPTAASHGGVRVSLTPAAVAIAPGSSAVIEARIYNTGSVLDEFAVEAVGMEDSWLAAAPERISLLPDKETLVRVTISLPGDAPLPAGEHIVGIKVYSVIHSDVSRVEEVRLSVQPVQGAALVLEPQTVKAGARASVLAHVINRGNQPVEMSLQGDDSEKAIEFEFQPAHLRVPPFTTATSRVRMFAPRPTTGSPTHRAYQVSGGGDVVARGTFVQKARISPFLVRMLSLVLGISLIGGVAMAIPSVRRTLFPSATTTTLPPVPAAIEFFTPDGEPDASGCVTLSWSVSEASEVVLDTPTERSTVEAAGERSVCGATGDTVTLEAIGGDGVAKTADYRFFVDLTMSEPKVSVSGRTVIFDVETNQTSDVTVVLVGRGVEKVSTGKSTHHLEVTDQDSGTINWTATATVPGQTDVVQSGSVDMPYYSLRVSVVDGPRFVANPVTTVSTVAPSPDDTGFFLDLPLFTFPAISFNPGSGTSSFWFGYVATPVTRFLERDCPGEFIGQAVNELIVPLAEDGSAEINVSVDYCTGEGPVEPLSEDPDIAQPIKVSPGFEATGAEKLLVFPANDGVVEMTLLVERIHTEERPEYP